MNTPLGALLPREGAGPGGSTSRSSALPPTRRTEEQWQSSLAGTRADLIFYIVNTMCSFEIPATLRRRGFGRASKGSGFQVRPIAGSALVFWWKVSALARELVSLIRDEKDLTNRLWRQLLHHRFGGTGK